MRAAAFDSVLDLQKCFSRRRCRLPLHLLLRCSSIYVTASNIRGRFLCQNILLNVHLISVSILVSIWNDAKLNRCHPQPTLNSKFANRIGEFYAEELKMKEVLVLLTSDGISEAGLLGEPGAEHAAAAAAPHHPPPALNKNMMRWS